MSDLTNLPKDIAPADFFQLIIDALADEPAPETASPEKLQVNLHGDQGGGWMIGFEDGKLSAPTGQAASPPLQVSLSVDDWRAFVAGDVRDAVATKVDHGGFDPKSVAKLYAVTNKTEQIKAYSGDLQLVVENGGSAHKLTLTFGGTTPDLDNPTTTVSVTLDDFVLLASGELNPQAAFFAGKIRLDGDMNLAMSLMALAMG